MNLDKLDTICAAAIQQAYKHGEDARNLCVLIHRSQWQAVYEYMRNQYLFELRLEGHEVFIYRGVFVSWSPLILGADGWATGVFFNLK